MSRAGVDARLARAFPDLDAHSRVCLARDAARARALQRAGTRRALRASDVELCRGLTMTGWEHLHAATETATETAPDTACVLHLPSPWGSPRLAVAALRVFRPDLAEIAVGTAEPEVECCVARGEALLRWDSDARDAVSWSARLAHAAGAAILPVSGEVTADGGWRVEWRAPIVPGPEDTVAAIEERCLEPLRERLREAPERWPWNEIGWI